MWFRPRSRRRNARLNRADTCRRMCGQLRNSAHENLAPAHQCRVSIVDHSGIHFRLPLAPVRSSGLFPESPQTAEFPTRGPCKRADRPASAFLTTARSLPGDAIARAPRRHRELSRKISDILSRLGRHATIATGRVTGATGCAMSGNFFGAQRHILTAPDCKKWTHSRRLPKS